MDILTCQNVDFYAHTIATEHGSVLLIQAPHGMLGCGYFSIETADKLDDALVVVTGVKNYNDMLCAEVKKVSAAAARRGIEVGMTGKDALEKML